MFKFNLQNYVKYYEYDENDASDLEEDVEQDTSHNLETNPNMRSMKLPKSVHDNLNAFHGNFLSLMKNKSFQSKLTT